MTGNSTRNISGKGEKTVKEEIWKELVNLKPIEIELSHIYLDPNNPRLQTPGKQKVSDSRIIEPGIQDSCLEYLEKEGIDDLRESIRNSGFWTVDRIVLRELKDGNYVVLEGNRRVASLKTLAKYHRQGNYELNPKILAGIEKFEALVYEGKNPDISWIIQGFRHTPGIKKWEDYPKSVFLARFEKESGKSANEIAVIVGMKPRDVTHSIRSFYGHEDARKDEEYGDEVSPDKFGHFNEIIFKKDEIKDWLGWDDKKREFKDKKNLRKYLKLSIPQENGDKPILTISPETRDVLPELIKPENKKLFDKLEQGSISLDGAMKELDEYKCKREPIDMSSIMADIDSIRKVVETLPIPSLQLAKIGKEKEEKDTLLKKLKELHQVLEAQIKNLTRS